MPLAIHVEFVKPLALHPERMYAAMVGAVSESERLMEKEIRDRAPVGVGGEAGLRGSIAGEVKQYATKIEGIVGTPLRYGPVVEYGRRAGAKMPPVSALIPWVERFLTIEKGQSAKGVAFAVARYMAQRGSRSWRQSPPGERMFLRGFEAAEPVIRRLFAERFRDAVHVSME